MTDTSSDTMLKARFFLGAVDAVFRVPREGPVAGAEVARNLGLGVYGHRVLQAEP